jgi:uncharacterized RDD family membrane protein YckC
MADPGDLTPRPAGLLRRFGAMLYDALLVLAVWLVTLFAGVAMAGHAVVGPTIQSLLFIELFGFFSFFWVARGQTLGMLAWRLHVVTLSGERMRLSHALLRFVGALLAFATLGVGYLWYFIDPGRRTWPDLLSGTEIRYTPTRAA